MTETLIILGKLLASSALLLAFYWCVLRNHASYNLTRLYLLLLPLASLLMSGVNIPVYQTESSIVQHVAPAIAQSFEAATTTTEATPTIEAAQVPAINTSASAPSHRANTKVTLTTTDYNRLLLFLWAAVSVTLLFIAICNLISLHIKSRRLVTQITPRVMHLSNRPKSPPLARSFAPSSCRRILLKMRPMSSSDTRKHTSVTNTTSTSG